MSRIFRKRDAKSANFSTGVGQITQGPEQIFYVAPQGQLMAAPTQIASDEPMPVAGTRRAQTLRPLN
jgi:hypothetical protein